MKPLYNNAHNSATVWASVTLGDLVQLNKGEQVIRGYVRAEAGGLVVTITGQDSDFYLDHYRRTGWMLSIRKRAEPKKPEPGVYLDYQGDVWAFPPPSYGTPTQEPAPIAFADGSIVSSRVSVSYDWRGSAPFTRIAAKEGDK